MSREQKIHLFVIILANIFPLLGVFLLGWNPFGVYFIYIAETILIAIFATFLFILKILFTKHLYLFFSIFILLGNLFVLIGQISIPFVFMLTDSGDISLELVKQIIFEVRTGVALMALSNLYGMIVLVSTISIKEIDDLKLSTNVFFRNTFGFFVFVIALVISEMNYDFFSDKMNLIAAITVILLQLIFSIASFIFSLKSPQKTLPS